MKKILILALMLILSFKSLAAIGPSENYAFEDTDQLYMLSKKQKITVMVGLGLDHVSKNAPSILRPLVNRHIKEIGSWFTDFYKNDDFEVELMFYPSRFNIWTVLNNPDNVAVFWIGHGSESKNGNNKLFDGDGFNITEIFSGFHPNLRFLGLIGCYSKKSFESLSKEFQIKKRNPKLEIVNFDDKVRLDHGVKQSLLASKKILDRRSVKNGYTCEAPKATGIRIKIERRCMGNDIPNIGHFPAVTVHTSHDNRVITAFPRCLKSDEVQTQWAWIKLTPSDYDSNGDLKSEEKLNLRITSGERLMRSIEDYTKLDLGVFIVTHKNQEKWFGIVDPDGTVSTQVDEANFTFSENDITIQGLHSHNEYFCQDIPERMH